MRRNLSGLRRVARRNRWRLSRVKKEFVVQGDDRVGAVARHLDKLGAKRIKVVAADAVTAGKRYGMILWVKQKDYARAARALLKSRLGRPWLRHGWRRDLCKHACVPQ